MNNTAGQELGAMILGLIFISIYLVPTVIAFQRNHVYRFVILAINLFLGLTGVGWIMALIWSIWPSERSLADPILGNVTGIGLRNVGDTIGSVNAGVVRGEVEERSRKLATASNVDDINSQLRKFAGLRDEGILTNEEFDAKKRQLLGL